MDSETDSSTSSKSDCESQDDTQEWRNSSMIPERSRERYLKTHKDFMEWKTSKGVKYYTEDVFLEYFKELAKTKKSPTLWSLFSMLRSTVRVHHGVEINTYKKLRTYLKIQSKGYVTKKSKVFTAEDVETFLRDAPDDIYLPMKVALIFGLNGSCRGFELAGLRICDVEKHSDGLMLINIMKTPDLIERSFIIRNEFVQLVEKYIAMRPPDLELDRFFICYRNGICRKQAIGRNTISAYPRQIASFLGLPNPELYTGHCFRNAGGLSSLAQSSANSLMLRHSGSQRGNTYTEDYLTRKATMRLRSADPTWKLKQAETQHKSSSETQLEFADETHHSESSVKETQSVDEQRDSLDETEQIKSELSDGPADESFKTEDGLDDDGFDYSYAMQNSPPHPPKPRLRSLFPLRQLAALERRRLRLDEVRARQLHARETRRLCVEARRVEVDQERNEVLRRIADVAFALLEKSVGNGMLLH